jgi:hypothetical protein
MYSIEPHETTHSFPDGGLRQTATRDEAAKGKLGDDYNGYISFLALLM